MHLRRSKTQPRLDAPTASVDGPVGENYATTGAGIVQARLASIRGALVAASPGKRVAAITVIRPMVLTTLRAGDHG